MKLPSVQSIVRIAKLGAAVFTVTAVSSFAGTSMLRAQVDWRFLFDTSTSSAGNTSFPVAISSSSKPISSAKSSSKSTPPTGIQRCCIPSTGACMGLDFTGCANGVVMDAAYCPTACPTLRSSSSSSISSSRPSSSSSVASSIPQACCNYNVPGGSCTAAPVTGCPQGTIAFPVASCSIVCPKLAATTQPRSSTSTQTYSYPMSRASSVSSMSSAPVSSSSSSSSSSVMCCTCYYQEHAKCLIRTAATCIKKECNDGIDNDKDGDMDGDDTGCVREPNGTMQDESEDPNKQSPDCTVDNGVCKSRFYGNCKKPEHALGCNQARVLPKGSPEPYPAEWKCTDFTTDTEEGHEIPGQCTDFLRRAYVSFQCNDARCQTYVNRGCGALAQCTEAEAKAVLQNIQTEMAARGIEKVTVSGNQMIASTACQSTVAYTVTVDAISTDYGWCDFGSMCHQPGEKYTCKGYDNKIYQGICCRQASDGKPTKMEDAFGGTCPAHCFAGFGCKTLNETFSCTEGGNSKTMLCCADFGGTLVRTEPAVSPLPKCPARVRGDTEYGKHKAYSCATAKAESEKVAIERLKQYEQKCSLTPGSTFERTCTSKEESRSITSCAYLTTCAWTCKW